MMKETETDKWNKNETKQQQKTIIENKKYVFTCDFQSYFYT